MSAALAGAVVGGAAASGLLLVTARLLVSRRPSLESRVLPYVRDVPASAALWTPRPRSDNASSAMRVLVEPLLQRTAARLQRALGGRESVRRRLERAGSTQTVEQFRMSQVVWAAISFGGCLLLGLVGPARQPGRALPWLLLCIGVAGLGVMARDQLLSRQVKQREQRMLTEFPVVADLIALSVAAGEGPLAALDRVVSSCQGALPDELSVVLAESRTGVPVGMALESLSRRTGLAIVARFADGMAVAIERGTPLLDVLDAQAADVRESARRSLIETGARKEVVMMVPVVFIIMPITLLFAFFPGVVGLNLLAP